MYLAINNQTKEPFEFEWTFKDELTINGKVVDVKDYEIIETDYERRTVIMGTIFFDDVEGADIVNIAKQVYCYTEEKTNEVVDFAENNGYDYIIYPDYKLPINSQINITLC